MYVVPASTQFATVTKKTISGVHVSPGSAETLVLRGGVTNHHSIAYFLSNISAKNYQNGLMCVEVIVCNVSVFFRHSVVQNIPTSSVSWLFLSSLQQLIPEEHLSGEVAQTFMGQMSFLSPS